MTTTKHIFADSYESQDENGNIYWVIHCNYCEACSINGVPCHETGCHQAWRDYKVECKWCGRKFYPEEKGQEFCDESCADDYNGRDTEPPWVCRNCGRDETEVSQYNDDYCSELCQMEHYC